MDVAGVTLRLRCWGGRAAAGILWCCRGGVVEVVLVGRQGRRVVAAAVALSQAEGLLAVVPCCWQGIGCICREGGWRRQVCRCIVGAGLALSGSWWRGGRAAA